MTDPTPGIYLATYTDGTQRPVVVVLGPHHLPAVLPADGSAIVTGIVERNWRGIISHLCPLRRQGGLSGAMYWDDDEVIFLDNATSAGDDRGGEAVTLGHVATATGGKGAR